jgi:hypothetical protein
MLWRRLLHVATTTNLDPMARKSPPKPLPKLTDSDRHKRFVEMAREVEASEDPKEFDIAFKKVVAPPKKGLSD